MRPSASVLPSRFKAAARGLLAPVIRLAIALHLTPNTITVIGLAITIVAAILVATGYLKTNPNPSRAELAHGVSGNLCRCQDYDKILTALMRGAEHMRNA